MKEHVMSRPVIVTISAALAGAVLATVTVVGVTNAYAAPAADPSAVDELVVPCGAIWKRLPEELRDDLLAVQDLPDAEKPAAIREIRTDALAGEYGEKVATAAERIKERRARLFTRLPEDLQADLKALKALPDADKVAYAKEIRADALAGEYGERVQKFSEKMQDRREQCAA
jgi:hypothetical protein